MSDKGHSKEITQARERDTTTSNEDFVLEKSIFSNVFNKDIRRVFIYKKAERLAKAIHLVAPAFPLSSSLRNRLDMIAIGLVDAAIAPPPRAREALSRELLALSSILSIAKTGGLLSPMNTDLIAKEAHILLQEIATYEEPRLFLEDVPTLAELGKQAGQGRTSRALPRAGSRPKTHKGHVSDIPRLSERRDAILSVIKDKGTVYIKDISTIMREVSEKTIQRELQRMVLEGIIEKRGSRRWTAYFLASS